MSFITPQYSEGSYDPMDLSEPAKTTKRKFSETGEAEGAPSAKRSRKHTNVEEAAKRLTDECHAYTAADGDQKLRFLEKITRSATQLNQLVLSKSVSGVFHKKLNKTEKALVDQAHVSFQQVLAHLPKGVQKHSSIVQALGIQDGSMQLKLLEKLSAHAHMAQDKDKRENFEQRGLQLLNILFEYEVGDTTLTAEEMAELEDFILYAYDNKELNTKLNQVEKKDKVQEFLWNFSFKTKHLKEFSEVKDLMFKNLDSMQIDSLIECVDSLKATFSKVSDLVKKMKAATATMRDAAAKKAAQVKDPMLAQAYTRIFQRAETLLQVCERSTSVLPFSEKSLSEFIQDLHSAEQKLLYAVNEVAVVDKVMLRRANQLAHEVGQKIPPLLEELQRKQGELAALREQAGECAIEPIERDKFKSVMSLARLADLIPADWEKLPFFKDIFLKCSEAQNIRNSLDILVQAFPSYEPGDIVFHEEQKEKEYKGHESFSDKSLVQNLMNPEVWKMMAKREVFELVPIFTGRYLHMSMANIDENALSESEILGGYYNGAATFETALFAETLRPDISRLVTEEGKEALREMFPQASDEERYAWLQKQFQQKINYFCTHFSQIIAQEGVKPEQIENSAKRAALSVVKSLGLDPRVWFYSRPHLENWTFMRQQGAYTNHEMFCAEFISRSLIIAMNLLQADLSRQYIEMKERGHVPPGSFPAKMLPFFEEIIPTTTSPEAIHPTALYELLQKYFAPVEPPLAVSLLIA